MILGSTHWVLFGSSSVVGLGVGTGSSVVVGAWVVVVLSADVVSVAVGLGALELPGTVELFAGPVLVWVGAAVLPSVDVPVAVSVGALVPVGMDPEGEE
jgi:hypothetical protein